MDLIMDPRLREDDSDDAARMMSFLRKQESILMTFPWIPYPCGRDDIILAPRLREDDMPRIALSQGAEKQNAGAGGRSRRLRAQRFR